MMDRSTRSTAVHEAGHALAFWWNGRPIERITVRTKAEYLAGPLIDSDGNPHRVAGLVEALIFIPDLPFVPQGIGNDMPSIIPFVERDLLHYLAGPVAEATHNHTRLDKYLRKSGRNDHSSGDLLIALLPFHMQLHAEPLSIARSSCLVRRYWSAINVVADLLQVRGTVDGKDISALLCEATGESPTLCSNDLRTLETVRNTRWADERAKLLCRNACLSLGAN